MRFVRITTSNHSMYVTAMGLYRESFPEHELREALSQERIMGQGDYHFDLIYDGDTFVGLVLSWQTADFIYIEHFCIRPQLRGRRYGQQALALVRQPGKTVILEIDPPVDEISIRRKGFYERCGYRENPYAHVHPPYHRGNHGHDLVIMTCPEAISSETYNDFAAYLKNTVMKDVF